MKQHHHHTRRPAVAKARLLILVTLALWLGALPGLWAQAVPGRINYQGILLSGQGVPITAATDIQFRIWDTATGIDTNGLKWGRIFRVSPDTTGAFNAVLSDDGALASNAPPATLYGVFTGVGSDSRYLELSVGSTAIRPRQQFVASAYAFLASSALSAATVTGGGVISLTNLGLNSVDSLRIVDGSVANADLAPNSVDNSKIVDGTIVISDLAANSVDSSKIVDGTIVNADISASAAIADTKLATIATAGKVSDTALSANVALRSGGNTLSGNQVVNGNVQLGPSGQYQAVAGSGDVSEAPLRIIRGTMVIIGSGPNFTQYGTGFTFTRNAYADYTITFNQAFSGMPSFVGNAIDSSSDVVTIQEIDQWHVRYKIGTRSIAWYEMGCSFIAIGPR